jgi:hypothetical protein
MATPDITESVVARFWSKVDKSGDCWLWTGSRHRFGYGMMQIGRRPWTAHRISYAIAHGPIPDGAMVLHSCDNPQCVRLDHLRIGTARDNAADAVARGRKRKTYNYSMSVSDAAITMGVTEAELRAMIKSGEIAAWKSADWLVRRFTVSEWLGRKGPHAAPHSVRSTADH